MIVVTAQTLRTLEQQWRGKAGVRGRETWEAAQIDVRGWAGEKPGLPSSGWPLCPHGKGENEEKLFVLQDFGKIKWKLLHQ